MNFEESNFSDDNELTDILSRFEKMLKNNERTYFDVMEYEEIIDYYLDIRKPDEALKAVTVAIGQHPQSSALKLKNLQILLEKGQPIKVLKLMPEIQKTESGNCDFYLLKGNAYLQLGQIQDAIRQYNKAIEYVYDDKDDLLYNIAIGFVQANQYKVAIRYLEKAFDENNENISVIYELAYCYEKSDQYKMSIQLYKQYLDKNPFSDNVWYNLGILYNTIGKYEKAIDAYDFATAINKSYSSAYFNKANALVNMEMYHKAIESYMDFLEYEGDHSDAFCNIGECYEKSADYNNALIYYRKALKIDNLNPDAWFGIGVVYYFQEEYVKSVEYIKKAIAFDDENSEYWYLLGNVWAAIGNLKEANKAFRYSTDIDPFDYEAWLNFAEMYYNNDNLRRAINILNEAFELNSDVALVSYRLAAYHFFNNNNTQGLKYLEKGLNIDYIDHIDFIKQYPDWQKSQRIRKLINKYKK